MNLNYFSLKENFQNYETYYFFFFKDQNSKYSLIIRVLLFTILTQMMQWSSECSSIHPLYCEDWVPEKTTWMVLLGMWGPGVRSRVRRCLSVKAAFKWSWKATFHRSECCKLWLYPLCSQYLAQARTRQMLCEGQTTAQGTEAVKQPEIRDKVSALPSHTLRLTEPHVRHHWVVSLSVQSLMFRWR